MWSDNDVVLRNEPLFIAKGQEREWGWGLFCGGSHGFQGNGGGSVVRGTTELTANELPTGEIGRILKSFMGDQVNSIVTQPKSSKPSLPLTPPPPPRAKNDCSLMQINVSYATFTDISSINLNSLPLIRVVRIVKKELFLSYKTS